MLIINGFAYLIASITGLLFPHYEDIVSKAVFPGLFGEIVVMLWLLIKGAKMQALEAPAP